MSDALFSSDELPVPTEIAASGESSSQGGQAFSGAVVLARKWRPKRFEQVVGQDHVVSALAHALNAQRLHHAYLLTGTRGTGKTTLARIIAKALNCEQGISANPCGVCSSCAQIDGGRFVDYIEIDAASNRGVGEIQQLLEQAQFAPTSGRFKVYVIDEVHMLSNHAFNAMLKTLEEPPPDVKFLLATTDPQKIPVTVLSRCLQFNLKNVASEILEKHLVWVLEQEAIEAEPQALAWIANAAQGSVRDSLSLTDQAIAYGAGRVSEQAVQAMLGLVQRELLAKLLRAIADRNVSAAFAVLEELLTAGAHADALLGDLARSLHQAAARSALGIETRDDPTGAIVELAQQLDAESLQLFYQIVTLGRRDLSLAPDERTGLEMTLLRLFAFQPQAPGTPNASQNSPPKSSTNPPPKMPPKMPAAATAAATDRREASPSHSAEPQPAITPQAWPSISRTISVSGLARQFIQQAQLLSCADAGAVMRCRFRVAIPALTEAAIVSKAQEAMTQYFGKPCKIETEVGEVTDMTAAVEDADAAAKAQSKAEQAIQNDPLVQSLLQDLGGQIVPGSIRPANPHSKGNTT